jgi:hypothetical protein
MADGTFRVSTADWKSTDAVRAPVINAPQTATWCSRITTRHSYRGRLEGPMMSCSLSPDHRYLDGAEVTSLLNDLAGTLTPGAGTRLSIAATGGRGGAHRQLLQSSGEQHGVPGQFRIRQRQIGNLAGQSIASAPSMQTGDAPRQ